MMNLRKILSVLLVCTMIFALAACGQKETNVEEENTPPATSTTTPSDSESSASNVPTLDFPTKPVQIYCPWSAGGASDMFARAVAACFEKYTGQPAAVVTKEGAGGTIAHGELANLEADGYVLATTASGIFSSQPLLREVTYKIEDFDFLGSATYEPFVLAARAELGLNSIEDLRTAFKDKVINVGTQAAGSLPDMVSTMVSPELGVDYNIINYAGGAGELLPAVLGGHVDIGVLQPSEVNSYVEGGTMTVIGITAAERDKSLPDVQTLGEQGIDCELANIKGFLMPACSDVALKEYLENTMMEIFNGPEMAEFAEKNGMELYIMTGEEMEEFISNQTVLFKELAGK